MANNKDGIERLNGFVWEFTNVGSRFIVNKPIAAGTIGDK